MRSLFHRVHHFVQALSMALIACGIVLVPQSAYCAQVPVDSITVTGQPSAILIQWDGYPGAVGYLVWRSTDELGERARIVGTAVASETGGSFADLTATVGGRYRYAVSVIPASGDATTPSPGDWVLPVALSTSKTATSPHLGAFASKASQSCVRCHSLTDYQKDIGGLVSDLGRDDKTLSGLCLMCHTASAGDGISSVGALFSEGTSGHSVDTSVSAGNGLHSCSDCHNAHADSQAGSSLRPTKVRLAGEERAVDASDNGWCFACHTDGSSDEVLASPSLDATGYPVTGTFPGKSIYESATANVHASLDSTNTPSDADRPAGDCLHCHAAHRSASPYDSLLVVGDATAVALPNRAAGDVATLCVTCHTGVRDQLLSGESTGTAGHAVVTSGGFYEPGTALPCFVCHNPHGSKRGNKLNISDTLGQNLNPKGTPQEVMQFCFSCHTSSDGLGWNSAKGRYEPVPDDATVVGLSRVETSTALVQPLMLKSAASPFAVGIKGAPSRLRLASIPKSNPTTDPHDRRYQGDKTCSDCHGSAHSPSIEPEDVAAVSCYDCHSSLTSMDKASAQKTQTFHHALGSSTTEYTGGVFLSGYSAPSSANKYSKYCLTCHNDHFANPGQPALRTSAADATPASSDFGGSASSPGICLSCHVSARTRSGVNQKGAFTRLTSSTEITSVPKVDPTLYASSKHNYAVLTATGSSGNCVKCHNGAEAVGGSTLGDFSVHTSPNKSLISRIGDESDPQTWNSVPAQYKLCFQCHARKGEVATTSQIGKSFVGKDWYGAVSMGATRTVVYKRGTTSVGARTYNDEAVFSDMFKSGSSGVDLTASIPDSQKSVSGHLAQKIVSPADPMLKSPFRTSTTSVRCTDCHDVHKTSMGIMASGQEWPLTQKALVPATSAFANKTNRVTGANAWAKLDGTGADMRLITLNDFWYRDEQRKAGKSEEWIAANTVTVFCFECHSESGMAGKSHAAIDSGGPGTAGLDHKNGSLACVYCHVPAVHGSGMPHLLTDASTGVLPTHQVMTWYDPFKTTGNANQPVAKLFAISSTTDFESTKPTGCSTTNASDGGCHGALPSGWRAVSDATGTGWVNWVK